MTGSYSVVVKRSAERELRAVPQRDLGRVVARIWRLADDPRPPGSEKLSGQDRLRLRQGDYRVVYAVDDKRRIVEIVKIGSRREVYRD